MVLRMHHEAVRDGRTPIDPRMLPVERYEIPEDFDAIVTAEARRVLDTGEGGWIESAEHRPSAAQGEATQAPRRGIGALARPAMAP